MQKPPTDSSLFFYDPDELPGKPSVGKDGLISVQTPAIRTVCLHDITQVQEYRVSEVMGTVAHAVYFRNGGRLFYNYGIDGSGHIELRSYGVDIHHLGNGFVVAKPRQGPVNNGSDGHPSMPLAE